MRTAEKNKREGIHNEEIKRMKEGRARWEKASDM
jgi:hypothetical protein